MQAFSGLLHLKTGKEGLHFELSAGDALEKT
jgi:hypothetical protein